MGQEDLTKQYSMLFEKKGGKNLWSFVLDVYRSGKSREISSFVIWELFHRLGIFPKQEYLKFNGGDTLMLKEESMKGLEFFEKIDHFFKNKELGIVNSKYSWKLLFKKNDKEIFGCLYPDDQDLYSSTDKGESVVFVKRFPERIKSIFISSQGVIFVCVKGAVFKSSNYGASFEKALDLGSAESFFRHNNAMAEMPDKTLIIGEYGNIWDKGGWRNLANLYFSFDGGETWQRSEFLKRRGTNKHVHVVHYSKLLNRLLVADGDNYKKLWISDSSDSLDPENLDLKAVNKHHIQMGGYTAVVEHDRKLFFGTDYQGGTNFIVETGDGIKFTKRILPDPYRRSPIDNMVLRKSRKGVEIWANLPYSTAGTKCLLMYTADGGKSWNKVIEYNRAAHTVWILNASNEIVDELYISIENSTSKDRMVYKITDR